MYWTCLGTLIGGIQYFRDPLNLFEWWQSHSLQAILNRLIGNMMKRVDLVVRNFQKNHSQMTSDALFAGEEPYLPAHSCKTRVLMDV